MFKDVSNMSGKEKRKAIILFLLFWVIIPLAIMFVSGWLGVAYCFLFWGYIVYGCYKK